MDREPPWDTRERLFEFACDVVDFCRKLGAQPGCRHIAEQLMDAATSAAANAEEAKSAYSRREFAYKNSVALKEARESQLWLRLVVRCKLGDPETAKRLVGESGALVGILTGTVRAARRPPVLGTFLPSFLPPFLLPFLLPFAFCLFTSSMACSGSTPRAPVERPNVLLVTIAAGKIAGKMP